MAGGSTLYSLSAAAKASGYLKRVCNLSTGNHLEPFHTSEEVKRLVSAFETCTLPREEWNHRAHLTVGLWYLSKHEKAQATNLIRESIQKYNHACGIIQTNDSGYHETITLFYVWLVSKYLGSVSKSSIVEIMNGLLNTYGDKRFPLEYYSKERLMSWEARTSWVEPDLKPLD